MINGSACDLTSFYVISPYLNWNALSQVEVSKMDGDTDALPPVAALFLVVFDKKVG